MTRKKTASKTPTKHARNWSPSGRRCGFARCSHSLYAKGFCNSHYRQMLDGRPLAPLNPRGGSRPRPVIPRLVRNVLVDGRPYDEVSTVERRKSCWIWQGSVNSNGYGQMSLNGGMISTHRASYQAFVGPIGTDTVHHECGEKRCVNPDHLSRATMRENLCEMHARRSYEKTIACQRDGLAATRRQVEDMRDLLVPYAASSLPVDLLTEHLAERLAGVLATLDDVASATGSRPVAARTRSRPRRGKARCRR